MASSRFQSNSSDKQKMACGKIVECVIARFFLVSSDLRIVDIATCLHPDAVELLELGAVLE